MKNVRFREDFQFSLSRSLLRVLTAGSPTGLLFQFSLSRSLDAEGLWIIAKIYTFNSLFRDHMKARSRRNVF